MILFTLLLSMQKLKISIISFCLFTFCCSQLAFSQSYKTIFGQYSTGWNVLIAACDYSHTKIQNVDGDTVINGFTYKKLTDTKGFLREDTLQGKAWLFDTISNAEHLIMDLSLEVSDTFYCYNYNWHAQLFTVDSVYYENNLKHVRFGSFVINQCSFQGTKIEFIEGMGCTAGLEFQGEFDSYIYTSTLCQFKDGDRVFHSEQFNWTGECVIEGGGLDELNQSTFEVYPNPVEDFLIIKNTLDKPQDIFLLDQQGRLIQAYLAVESDFQISTLGLNAGIYLLQSATCVQRIIVR